MGTKEEGRKRATLHGFGADAEEGGGGRVLLAVAGRSRSPNGGAVGSLMNVSNVSQSSKACSGDIVVSGHAQPFKDVGTGALVMESKARCLGALYNGQDHIRWSRSALE